MVNNDGDWVTINVSSSASFDDLWASFFAALKNSWVMSMLRGEAAQIICI